jgi:hypothetical protein
MSALLSIATLLLLQAPGDAWGMVDSRPDEVKRLYWDLYQTTEVWVTLSPVTGNTVAGPRFAFQAFFPGQEVKGTPQRIQIKALGGNTSDLSLRVSIDGKTTDLTGPEGTSSFLYPPCGPDEGCGAIGVVADLKPDLLRSMATAANVELAAFGSTFQLSSEDRAALGEFAGQIGLGR